MVDIYRADVQGHSGIETMTEYFEPGTKDFSAVLAKLAFGRPDYLFPGYTDAALYDIVRQSTEGNYFRKFFLTRGSTGPGAEEQGRSSTTTSSMCRNTSRRPKRTTRRSSHFIAAYKAFYKRDFPYDQAPLCSSSCYDHVFMLVEAMKTRRQRRRRGEDPQGAAVHDLSRLVEDQLTTITPRRSFTSTSST